MVNRTKFLLIQGICSADKLIDTDRNKRINFSAFKVKISLTFIRRKHKKKQLQDNEERILTQIGSMVRKNNYALG